MPRSIVVGEQDFAMLRTEDCFYVDKTHFIGEWWRSKNRVTLITRPRRFGKSLMMDTLERFFSSTYHDQEQLFSDLNVWQDEETRKVAGKYPVISLSFADCKGATYAEARAQIINELIGLLDKNSFLKNSPKLSDQKRTFFAKFNQESSNADAQYFLKWLCEAFEMHYAIKPIVLLDEYDTPLLSAWLNGFWDDLVKFMQPLMGLTFKNNKSLTRGLMFGITRVSKESIFSDLNNPDVITTTSQKYATGFGFTEKEVFAAMDEYGLTDKAGVKAWYDGFTFGNATDIYNPWSITKYLESHGKLNLYWANTASNELISRQLQKASSEIKTQLEALLEGRSIEVKLSEEITFRDLDATPNALWSLLLASGYLKITEQPPNGCFIFKVAITNKENRDTFNNMVQAWFYGQTGYSEFLQALTADNVEYMNVYLQKLTQATMSYFDVSQNEPEKFYHGFVLGLLTSLQNRFVLTSNRESGLGRYDILLEPIDRQRDLAYIIEFKTVFDVAKLKEAVSSALQQIRDKAYAAQLTARGIDKNRIRAYGIAFAGKHVLVENASVPATAG